MKTKKELKRENQIKKKNKLLFFIWFTIAIIITIISTLIVFPVIKTTSIEPWEKDVDKSLATYPNLQPSLYLLDKYNEDLSINFFSGEISILQNKYTLLEINTYNGIFLELGKDIPKVLDNTIIFINDSIHNEFNIIDLGTEDISYTNVVLISKYINNTINFYSNNNMNINNSYMEVIFRGYHDQNFIKDKKWYFNRSTSIIKTDSTFIPDDIKIYKSHYANINNLLSSGWIKGNKNIDKYYINKSYIFD